MILPGRCRFLVDHIWDDWFVALLLHKQLFFNEVWPFDHIWLILRFQSKSSCISFSFIIIDIFHLAVLNRVICPLNRGALLAHALCMSIHDLVRKQDWWFSLVEVEFPLFLKTVNALVLLLLQVVQIAGHFTFLRHSQALYRRACLLKTESFFSWIHWFEDKWFVVVHVFWVGCEFATLGLIDEYFIVCFKWNFQFNCYLCYKHIHTVSLRFK